MKLKELFTLIEKIGSDNGIPKVYLCGGAVRDRLLDNLERLDDIDLTTGDAKVKNLAVEVSRELSKAFSIDSKQMDDSHTSIFLGNGFKLDFSSNFIDPSLVNRKDLNDLQKEMFSRDFSCNSAIMDLDLKKAYDPTKMAQKDIKNRYLRTCLAPEITLVSNKNRIIRVIYMAAKLNFSVAPEIIEFITKNKQLFSEISPGYLSKTLNKAVKYDINKTVELLDTMELWKSLPITETLYPHYAKRFIKTASSNRPSDKDLMDAIQHASIENDESWNIKDFDLRFEGNLTARQLQEFDSLDWMDIDPRAKDHSQDSLDDFRGKGWIERARKWQTEGIPPIVVITAPSPYQENHMETQIGDGRGRVNFATMTGMKIPVWHLVFKGKEKTAQLRPDFDYGEGFYANIQNEKSVADFRKKRKKKQKKAIKKIRDMKLK